MQTALISSIFEFGAMIGALSGGYFIKYGQWNCLMACNILATIGYGFLVAAEVWAVYVGRFLLSLAIGGFCIFVPKFVMEVTPIEYTGPIGGFSQFSITFGLWLPSIAGLTPYWASNDDDVLLMFARFTWAFPFLFLAVQVILLLTIFRIDSPYELKKKKRYEDLWKIMSRIYTSD